MAQRDLHNIIEPVIALNTAAIATSTTTSGNIVDTQGYSSVEVVVTTGTLTDGTFTPVLQEGDAADMSDASAVAAGDMLGSLVAFVAADDNKVHRFGYRGTKRYVRLQVTSAGVTSGGTLGALALLGHPRNAPTA